jgi:UDP-3-O-[3-hydroxymyristoyl] glucosamine N-acyltransferase
MDVALRDLAAQLGGELIGDGDLRIARIGTLESAGADGIAFLAHPRYLAQLATTQAGCVIVAPAQRESAVARGAAIVTADPYLYFARLTQWWAAATRGRPVPGIHPGAWVHAEATVAPGASIGPGAVIDAGARIGEGAVVGPHCVVESGASVGAGTRLASSTAVS